MKTDVSEAKKILGIVGDFPPGVEKTISTIKNADELLEIATVLKGAKKLSKLSKIASCLPFLDLAFLGIDIWVWTEENTESERVTAFNKLR
jgi:hypothetical protein